MKPLIYLRPIKIIREQYELPTLQLLHQHHCPVCDIATRSDTALAIYLQLGKEEMDAVNQLLKNVEAESAFIKGFGLLAAAYLLGHFIGQLSAYLDEWIYDPLKKKVFPNQNRVLKVQCIRKDKYGIQSNPVYVNAYKWSLYKLQQEMPEAAVEVNRYMADSKFFRSFFVLLLILAAIETVAIFRILMDSTYSYLYLESSQFQKGCWFLGFGLILFLGIVIYILNRRDAEQEKKDLAMNHPCEYIEKLETTKEQEQKKRGSIDLLNWFKSYWTSIVLTISIGLMFTGIFFVNHIVGMLLSLAVFSLVRYFKKRDKSTETSYQYIIFLETQNSKGSTVQRKRNWRKSIKNKF